MENKTFVEQYKALTPTQRDRVDMEITRRCNVALWTVRYTWATGKRTPKDFSQLILSEIFDTPKSILFPDVN